MMRCGKSCARFSNTTAPSSIDFTGNVGLGLSRGLSPHRPVCCRHAAMRRNSYSTVLPAITVRLMPSIEPPRGVIHCSSTRPLARGWVQQPDSHERRSTSLLASARVGMTGRAAGSDSGDNQRRGNHCVHDDRSYGHRLTAVLNKCDMPLPGWRMVDDAHLEHRGRERVGGRLEAHGHALLASRERFGDRIDPLQPFRGW